MRSLLLLLLLLQAAPAGADVYAYGNGADALWFTDVPRAGHDWRLLYRAADAGRRASAPLDAQCVARLVAGAPQERGQGRDAAYDADAQAGRITAEVGTAIDSAAEKWAIDPDLLRAVIWVESRCNRRALSAKGARGLMQLMPATARQYGVTDAFDARTNIWAGAGYLRDLLTYFSGNLELALAAYNAGPRAVVSSGMRIPPYRETQAYVPAILQHMRLLKQP
jgi:soluble lytic murein transglycosylase-like protein